MYVLYSKDKRHSQDNQDKSSSRDEVQRTKKIPMAARFSATLHTGPEAHPASYTMGTGFFSRG